MHALPASLHEKTPLVDWSGFPNGRQEEGFRLGQDHRTEVEPRMGLQLQLERHVAFGTLSVEMGAVGDLDFQKQVGFATHDEVRTGHRCAKLDLAGL